MKYISGNNALTSEERELKLGSLQYLLDHDIPPSYSDYRYQKLRNLETNKIDLARQEQMPLDSQDKKTITKLRNDIAIDEYTLERNIETYMVPDDGDNYFDMNGFLPVFSNSTMLIMVINVLIIIVAGSIISTEFSSGTIKFLLINPIKRWKILVAKYLAVLTVGIIMLVIYYVFNLLLAGIFFGFGDMGAPLLSVVNGKVHAGSSLLYVAWKYILGSLGVLTMATFAFAVSSLVRNSALAIGLGTFLLLSGYGAVFILASGLHWDWARYILFANTDINMIINNQTPFLGHTVGFALIVTAVYMVVFLLTAWDAFVRRDVK
jgi:ABC-2 type transport system permease protein